MMISRFFLSPTFPLALFLAFFGTFQVSYCQDSFRLRIPLHNFLLTFFSPNGPLLHEQIKFS